MLASGGERSIRYARSPEAAGSAGSPGSGGPVTGRERVAVSTVDVYIRKADGSDSFSLHSGLFGAATTSALLGFR